MALTNLYSVHQQLDRVPLGRQRTSRLAQVAARYFLTIPASIETMGPGATARMRDRAGDAQVGAAPAAITITDKEDAVVFTASIDLWVTAR